MTGTEKQIAWAEQIRQQARTQGMGRAPFTPVDDTYGQWVDEYLASMPDSARWWIDHRAENIWRGVDVLALYMAYLRKHHPAVARRLDKVAEKTAAQHTRDMNAKSAQIREERAELEKQQEENRKLIDEIGKILRTHSQAISNLSHCLDDDWRPLPADQIRASRHQIVCDVSEMVGAMHSIKEAIEQARASTPSPPIRPGVPASQVFAGVK